MSKPIHVNVEISNQFCQLLVDIHEKLTEFERDSGETVGVDIFNTKHVDKEFQWGGEWFDIPNRSL